MADGPVALLAWLCLLVALPLAGCVGTKVPAPVPAAVDLRDEGLAASGAVAQEFAPRQVNFTWAGEIGPGARLTYFGIGQEATWPARDHRFLVSRAVGSIAVSARAAGGLGVALLDGSGEAVCRAFGTDSAACESPTSPTLGAREGWSLRVYGDANGSLSKRYVAEARLVAGQPAAYGDLGMGVDPSIPFSVASTGFDGFEPTVGVGKSGAIFVVASERTLRSRDGGVTWQDVTPLVAQPTTFDPFLYVDPWTGRVFVDQLSIACTTLSWSDDEGESWTTNPAACGAPLDDHQKLTVGNHPGPAKTFDGVVYMSENTVNAALGFGQAKALVVSRSLDGGLSWTGSVALTNLEAEYRTTGPMAADRAGRVYLPVYLTNTEAPGDLGLVTSLDYGLTWRLSRLASGATATRGADPSAVVDPDGNLFLAYSGHDGNAWLLASRDQGATWLPPLRINPPPLASTIFPVAVAGSGGRVAVAYLGTPDTDRNSQEAPPWTRWHAYVGLVEDAFARERRVHTARVTPAEDPVQVGSLCAMGVRCAADGNRNHADFIGAARTASGQVVVGFVDGCAPGCDAARESRASGVTVAVMRTGPLRL